MNRFSKIIGLASGTRTRRTASTILLLTSVFLAGYSLGDKEPPPLSVHDMIVNHPDGLTSLVTPDDKRVKALARELKTPENAYKYLRDQIAFDPSLPSAPAGDIITEKRASCLGKSILLCSLYIAIGMKPEQVRVVTGEVEAGQGILDHAWVELEYGGNCLQQDTTDLLGTFGFDQFKGMNYTNAFIKRENYTFNNSGFAIISRLNMMKNYGHPVLTKTGF
ncbi:MAG: transglutaminase domain-containing protein [Geobacteraceae bacterium]|nr:transglutaminase domain-containing protein [Geobacteraceae bacterium]